MSAAEMINDRRQLGSLGAKVTRLALGVGVVGLGAGAIITAMSDGDHKWDDALRSYMVAFMWVLSICLGALFWTMVQHATRAGWSVVLRRICEGIAANMMWMWILFIPVALGVFLKDIHIFHWVHPEGDDLLEHKKAFLNPTFWIIRAVVFFGLWAFLSRFFFTNSVAQDKGGDVKWTHRMQALAPAGLLAYALSQSFGAIDWIMSLEAHWFSTMFGVYFFAGSCTGFFAMQILTVFALQRSGRLTDDITLEHYQDMGKLLFAFGCVFWAYIGFSQFMLIWYANIPEETGWFMVRMLGPWGAVSGFLVVGHFVLPFLLLVTKHTKRIPIVLAVIAFWMLMMHYVDMYWLVKPTIPAHLIENAIAFEEVKLAMQDDPAVGGWHPSIVDLCCLVGMAGLFVAMTANRLAKVSLVPERDPRLAESLAFENM